MNAPLNLVLDTNVVLDWWVFDDPRLVRFRHARDKQQVVVLRSVLSTAELRRVLSYRKLKLDIAQQTQVLATYESHSTPARLPDGFAADHLMLPAGFPRCRDHDDQHFLALCYHARADALVSRDRALLSLRDHAARIGLTIVDVAQLDTMLAARAAEGIAVQTA